MAYIPEGQSWATTLPPWAGILSLSGSFGVTLSWFLIIMANPIPSFQADPPLTAASGFCVWSDTCLISTLKVVALPQAYSMQSQESGVHYSRWDSSSRDEVSVTAMSSSEEASCYRRYSPNRPEAPTVLTIFVQAQPLPACPHAHGAGHYL